MIDFLKSALVGQTASEWLNNPNLRESFKTIVSNETGQIKEQRAFYRGQTICVKPGGYVEVYGSIHKFYTGKSNATDFTSSALVQSVAELADSLRFDPYKARMQNVEFGVNLVLPTSAKALLSRAILYGNSDFTSRRTFDGNGYQLDAKHQRYTFKPYDKAAQMRSAGTLYDGHMLRPEIRVTKMIHLAHANLVTLGDLTRPQSLAPLGPMLTKAWDNILFFDPSINLEGLSKPRRDLLLQGQSITYWQRLKPDSFRKQRRQFREWTEQYSDDPILEMVKAELTSTYARLVG